MTTDIKKDSKLILKKTQTIGHNMILLKYLMKILSKQDNVHFYIEIYFQYLGCQDVSVITNVAIVGLMLEVIEKTIDQQNYVQQQQMK